MVLMSRSALLLNTTITVSPGTLGGFQGGGGIARSAGDVQLSDARSDLTLSDLVAANSAGALLGLPSNGLNGPGAANFR